MNPFGLRDLPIRTKLRLIVGLAVMVSVGITGALMLGYQVSHFRSVSADALVVRARILAANSTAALAFRSEQDAREIIDSLAADPRVESAAVFDRDGRIFTRYLSPGASLDLPAAPPKPGMSYDFDANNLRVWVPIVLDRQTIGTIAIRRGLSDLYIEIRNYLILVAGVLVVAGSASLWFAQQLQGLIAEPVVALARAARRVTEQRDFRVRVRPVAADEIGQLTEAFNTMLETIGARTAETAALHDETAKLYAEVRKHAEELEMRVRDRTLQLEYANEELEAFTSSVSHDLRGPLRHIEGYASSILEDEKERLSEFTQEYLKKIVERTGAMNQLIQSLLEFSRLSTQALRPERVDMGALAQEVFAELTAGNPAGQARLDVGPLPPARADPTLARQILVNLIGNALKYSRGRMPAIIQVGPGEPPGNGQTAYFVRDNGIGFDMQQAGKLFRVFERLHSSKEFEGTGIGLTTVKRIVQRHGGRIWAVAAVDSGATFHFTLPTA